MMFKPKWLILLLIITTISTSHAGVRVHPWVSLSSLWGQGNVGIRRNRPSSIHYLKYDFVWNWEEERMTYHQVTPYIDWGKYSLGVKYRHQLSQDEYTPFMGYFYPFEIKYPMSLYNEVEYRMNSVVKDEDYVRTRHIFTLYTSKAFQEKYHLRPYAAIDTFVDWDDNGFEKTRLNLGYFLKIKKMSARVYVIPWTDGIQEEEWDDNSRFGATVTYRW